MVWDFIISWLIFVRILVSTVNASNVRVKFRPNQCRLTMLTCIRRRSRKTVRVDMVWWKQLMCFAFKPSLRELIMWENISLLTWDEKLQNLMNLRECGSTRFLESATKICFAASWRRVTHLSLRNETNNLGFFDQELLLLCTQFLPNKCLFPDSAIETRFDWELVTLQNVWSHDDRCVPAWVPSLRH